MNFRCLFLLLIPVWFNAQIPDYYKGIDFAKPSNELKIELEKLVTETHQYSLSYTPEVRDVILEADIESSNPNKVVLIYGYDDNDGIAKTDRTRDKDAVCNFSGDCRGLWNREHVYAKSLATPKLILEGAGTDAHAIRACDVEMNSWRSNRIFEDGKGNATVTPRGNFYPGDEWKGDVARMIMYMYLRYPEQCNPYHTAYTKEHQNEMPSLFLKWNAEDPPNEMERRRNDIIASQYQGNRNPFIDNPYLAYLLWGGDKAENTWGDFLQQEYRPKSDDNKIKTIQQERQESRKSTPKKRRRSAGSLVVVLGLVFAGIFLVFLLKKK